jgi:hypothetical protein
MEEFARELHAIADSEEARDEIGDRMTVGERMVRVEEGGQWDPCVLAEIERNQHVSAMITCIRQLRLHQRTEDGVGTQRLIWMRIHVLTLFSTSTHSEIVAPISNLILNLNSHSIFQL